MKRYFEKHLPHHFFDTPAVWQSFLLGLIYLFFLITQLYTFEDFPAIVNTFSLPGGNVTVAIVSAMIPLLEVASIPFLMSMTLPRRWLDVSRTAVVAVSVMWLVITCWILFTGTVAESGLLGATMRMPSGWWTLIYMLLVFMAALVTVHERSKIDKR